MKNKKLFDALVTALLALPIAVSLAPVVSAQTYAPPPAGSQAHAAFSQQDLDQMLAPIALYPDALLSQILIAATYPLEVVQAARWSRANAGAQGDRAVRAIAHKNWDTSVKSLVAFPQILALMDAKLEWTERLGNAFLAQESQVTDSVQYLRQKAYAAGTLKSDDRVRVVPQGTAIMIESADPAVVYVPYYDPTIVYGNWWWPAPPVYWAPWRGYRPPLHGFFFSWGPGIPVVSGFFFGAFDWTRHHARVANVHSYYYSPTAVSKKFTPNHVPMNPHTAPVARHELPLTTQPRIAQHEARPVPRSVPAPRRESAARPAPHISTPRVRAAQPAVNAKDTRPARASGPRHGGRDQPRGGGKEPQHRG